MHHWLGYPTIALRSLSLFCRILNCPHEPRAGRLLKSKLARVHPQELSELDCQIDIAHAVILIRALVLEINRLIILQEVGLEALRQLFDPTGGNLDTSAMLDRPDFIARALA